MGFMDEKLWEILDKKAREEDEGRRPDQKVADEYMTAVKYICQYGVDLADTIRDSFPMFTLHNEVHICNVMRLMNDLLGEYVKNLTRDESAMLIMAACCHDIGMSFSENDKIELLEDRDRLNQYLDKNQKEYVKAYSSGNSEPMMTEIMLQRYLRSIHHERILDLLCKIEWPSILESKVEREDLIRVCQSHGKDIADLDGMEPTATVDVRFCAVLLRLADILDFDTSRAPRAVYEYSGFERLENAENLKSKEEWDKHLSSHGFDFMHVADRTYSYVLDYAANCKSMQVEQTVNSYLDWVDYELSECSRQLQRYSGKWKDFILPRKVKRKIKAEGYMSGQYRLTLDQEQIMELLVGRDLYSDPSVFVRELIQNAIDAVRTREKLDRDLPVNWKGKIYIRTWMDNEGYHWFRIEDNGIGMTEEIIKNYFLKIGCSYYNSDNFQQAKIRCKADSDYTPISRFGIGILSCFMGDEKCNRVEVSTKHFSENNIYYPALRLSMHGMNGYYYMASKEKNHMPGPMKGVTSKEKESYLKQAGTVIAVRTNLYQTGKYRSFKEIVDRYVTYPPVAIHYDGVEGAFDYPTEADFMDSIRKINPSSDLKKRGVIEYELTDEQIVELQKERPEIIFEKKPKLLLHCIPLNDYTESPFLSGAVLTVTTEADKQVIEIKVGEQKVKADVRVTPHVDKTEGKLGIEIELHFNDNFDKQMSFVREKMQRVEQTYFEIASRHEIGHYQREIVRAISDGYVYDSRWKKRMEMRYHLSDNKLKKEIQELQHTIKEVSGYDIPTEEETLKLQFYKNAKRNWIFEVCNLEEFDWYMKYFSKIRDKLSDNSIAAHNGILCGQAQFFFGKSYSKDKNLGTVVLLKDKYRPKVDVARDGIRGFSLEVACEIVIRQACIEERGIEMNNAMSDLLKTEYYYSTMSIYKSLLKERKDLLKQLKFKTEKGIFSYYEIETQIEIYGKLKVETFPETPHVYGWGAGKNLYKCLCVTFLKNNYLLKASFDKYKNDIYIFKKENKNIENDEDIFPVWLFVEPVDDSVYLTLGSKYNRKTCNRNHPLSQFIIKNGERLKESVPGVFNEMIRSLAEDEKDKLIQNINSLLGHLYNLPGGLFEIPEDLKLTENDFC